MELSVSMKVSDGEDTSSYFCHELRHMPIGSVDPSLAIGFYCKTIGMCICKQNVGA